MNVDSELPSGTKVGLELGSAPDFQALGAAAAFRRRQAVLERHLLK